MRTRAEPEGTAAILFAVAALVAATAAGAGLTLGRGPAALVLAGSFLLAAISALWSSIHELLSPDGAPENIRPATLRLATDDELDATLRAILDLDHEVSVGKILGDDEATLRLELRLEAKRLMKMQNARIDPAARERARLVVEMALTEVPPEGVLPLFRCASCASPCGEDDAFCKRCGVKISPEQAS